MPNIKTIADKADMIINGFQGGWLLLVFYFVLCG